MNKIILSLIFSFVIQFSNGQIVINEIDADTPSVDDKEFLEIKSETPNFSLDGYIVVFFNGSTNGGNKSYFNIDLDGYKTDINGLLLIGNSTVSPAPQLIIAPNLIQNGADAVAIYKASYFDFPDQTLATQNNLIDALVYDTNDGDVISLMNLLGVTEQINEGENGQKDTHSIQLDNDGNYFVGIPTPRKHNDGSGIVLNGIKIEISQDKYHEGDDINISFTAEANVTEDLTIQYSLNNGNFDNSDYNAIQTLTILAGSKTISTQISIIDDNSDEGDEVMIVEMGSLPDTFLPLNNFIPIRIIDNDFVIANYGTPTNPTYGIVESTQTSNYYSPTEGLSEDALKQAIQDIIANPEIVRAQSYAEIVEILIEADRNPKNSNEVWLVYTEQGRPVLDYQTSSNNNGKWNREHTFPRSRGGFHNIKEDDIINGKELNWVTNADSLRHGNSDAHALKAADGPENSSRGNQHYGAYNGPDGNLGSFKGDVARAVLYMEVRYNDLEIVNGYPNTSGQLGDLATLLEWHRNDPPDDYEMNRNNVVYNWQYNRNPFIDHPDLVEYIWGNKVGDTWNNPLSTAQINQLDVDIYPIPIKDHFMIKGLKSSAKIIIYDVNGVIISSKNTNSELQKIDLKLITGNYYMEIISEGKSIIKKIFIK